MIAAVQFCAERCTVVCWWLHDGRCTGLCWQVMWVGVGRCVVIC